MSKRVVFALILAALPAVAGACPPAPDHGAALEALAAEARAATSEAEGREVSNRMWALWTEAPDARAQGLLDRGMAKREGHDLAGALAEFDALVDYCPDYAEGYNQRALIRFLRGDYEQALPDLARALDLTPDHTGARTGLALTLMHLGRLAEARTELEAALAVNPWLAERHLMAGGGPLAPQGEDI